MSQSVIAIILCSVFSIVFPLGLMIRWGIKHKKSLWPIIAGMICFTVFAMGLEQILHYFVLIADSPASRAVTTSPVLYTLYGAFAAGFFEETGRLFGFGVLLKKRTDRYNAVAYGIGHGGIEVILVLGATYAVYLLSVLGVSFGDAATDALIQAQTAQLGLPAALVAMFERIVALSVHVGLSMLMFKAVKEKGKLWLYPVCILLHALVDAPAALYQLGIIRSVFAVEGWCLVMAVVLVWFGYKALFKGVPESVEEEPESEQI